MFVGACAKAIVDEPDASVDAGGGDVNNSGCPQYNLSTDPAHCGSCSHACASSEVCSNGTCKASCDAPLFKCANAGDGGTGACVDLTSDPNHCGQCATTCTTADAGALEAGNNGNPDAGIPFDGGSDAGAPWSLGTATCSKSTCGVTCPTNMTACSDGICYDTQNFHDHCGACGTACATDTEWCTQGHCCTTGTAWCGSACVDVLSDAKNCGGCGVTCGVNTPVCSGGQCTTAIIFSDAFTQNVTPTTQCTDWQNFRAKLTGTYSSVTISGSNDTVGRTCTGSSANTICQALHNKTTVSALSCGGFFWNVYLSCGSDVEISADNSTCTCTSSGGYDVRPCIGNLNWGGINGVTCTAPSQTLTVTCK